MKYLFISVIILTLSGCATYSTYKEVGKQGSKIVADEALQVKLWSLCNATTYGAIKRWISTDKGKADALRTICNGVTQADVETE